MSTANSAALPVAFLHPQPDEFSFVYRDGEPAVRIEPGQTLEVFTEDCFSGKLTAIDGKPREVAPFPRVNPLSGPIGIRGAAPGDILAIHFLSVRPARPWGVSTVSPNFGLLSGTRLTPNLQPELGERVWIWVVDEAQRTLRTMTRSGREIEAPLRPFHGSVGIAPAHGEVRNSVVPDAFGGNLDLPSLVEGTTLYLRVNAPEAKLWIGDGQFAQGDGEIAGTAVEGAMLTRLVTDVVRPADDIEWPRVETDDCIMVVGCARPLEDAARVASAGLVRWVADLCELALDDSLQLVSQSIRFRIGNLVNPVYSVAAILNKRQLPATKSILGDAHARLSKRKQI